MNRSALVFVAGALIALLGSRAVAADPPPPQACAAFALGSVNVWARNAEVWHDSGEGRKSGYTFYELPSGWEAVGGGAGTVVACKK